ncbi:tRNA(His) guanylyltransferase, partial [Tremellales sp. Uapishka_1]
MAKSRFEYVRNFELSDVLLPNTYMVVRIDGRGFHKFSDAHGFEKPNDKRALDLMDRAAKRVMEELKDVVLGFGESDEYRWVAERESNDESIAEQQYSFLIRKSSNLYSRRRRSAMSVKPTSRRLTIQQQDQLDGLLDIHLGVCILLADVFLSTATPLSALVRRSGGPLSGRERAHINNLYNTTNWMLILRGGESPVQANETLQVCRVDVALADLTLMQQQGTDSKDKNEILFSRFGINYNTLPAMFRKGSTVVRIPGEIKDEKENKKAKPYEGTMGEIVVVHEDLIGDKFWQEREWLLR